MGVQGPKQSVATIVIKRAGFFFLSPLSPERRVEGAAVDKGPLCEGPRDSAASEEMTCHRDLPGMSPAPSTWPGAPRSGRGGGSSNSPFPASRGRHGAGPLLFGMRVFVWGRVKGRGGRKRRRGARMSLSFFPQARGRSQLRGSAPLRGLRTRSERGGRPQGGGPAGSPCRPPKPPWGSCKPGQPFPPRAVGILSIPASWVNFLPPSLGSSDLSPPHG